MFFGNILNLELRRTEEHDGPTVTALLRTITEIKQCWSVTGWVTKNLVSRVTPCFGKHVKPLVPVIFAVVSIHKSALGPRGGFMASSPCVIHKEGLCPSNGDINRLMMINSELIAL
jgi:hypothetical protein